MKSEEMERYNSFYNTFFDEESKQQHKNPEQMTDARLIAQLDDIVQALTLRKESYIELSTTEPGRAYIRIKREIRQRLHDRANTENNGNTKADAE